MSMETICGLAVDFPTTYLNVRVVVCHGIVACPLARALRAPLIAHCTVVHIESGDSGRVVNLDELYCIEWEAEGDSGSLSRGVYLERLNTSRAR